MKLRVGIVLLATIFANVQCGPRCVLPLPRFAFFAPLILHTNGSLIETENVSELQPDLTIEHGEQVVLSCTPNYFKNYPDKKVLSASCEGQKELLVNGELKSFLRHLACEVRAVEEIITPVPECAGNMESVEFGYANPITQKSFVLGEACYSIDKGITQFIHVKASNAQNQAHYLRVVDSVDYFHKKHPSSQYKMDLLLATRLDELNERLRSKLGSKKVPFIEPRHLLGMDSLYSKQFASVLKLGWNYVPVIGYDHIPNLDSLQNDINNLNGDDVEVYMGTHGVLKLTGEDGKMHKIYASESDDRFPLPKYVWAVVVSGRKAAAFAVLNNPDATEADAVDDTLCASKCSELKWLNSLKSSERNVKKGYVTCCPYEELRAVVPKFQH